MLTGSQQRRAAAWYQLNIENGTLPCLSVRCTLSDIELCRSLTLRLQSLVRRFCRQDLVEMWCAGFHNDLSSVARLSRRLLISLSNWLTSLFFTMTTSLGRRQVADSLDAILPHDPVCQKALLNAGFSMLTMCEAFANCDSIRTLKDNQFVPSVPIYRNSCVPLRLLLSEFSRLGVRLMRASANRSQLKDLPGVVKTVLNVVDTMSDREVEGMIFKVERETRLSTLFQPVDRWDPSIGLHYFCTFRRLHDLATDVQRGLRDSVALLRWGLAGAGFGCLVDLVRTVSAALPAPFLSVLQQPNISSLPILTDGLDADSGAARREVARMQLRMATAFMHHVRRSCTAMEAETLRSKPQNPGVLMAIQWTQGLLDAIIEILTEQNLELGGRLKKLEERAIRLVNGALKNFPSELNRLLCVDLTSGKVFTYTDVDHVLETRFYG